MRTFRFDKLVRDKIVDHQLANGAKPDYRVLDDKEYLEALKAKLLEEASELDTSDHASLLSELADLQEVIDATLQAIKRSTADLRAQQAKKNAKNGAFKKRLYIKHTAIKDDDPWIEYYLKNPDKYPEIT